MDKNKYMKIETKEQEGTWMIAEPTFSLFLSRISKFQDLQKEERSLLTQEILELMIAIGLIY